MRACSNSAMEPRIWKNLRPGAVEVLIEDDEVDSAF